MMAFQRWGAAWLCAAGLVAAAAVPAQANWAFTKWNMTPDEVKKASPSELEPPDEVEQRLRSRGGMILLLTGQYRMGSFEFDADFMFDEDQHLQRVVLDLENMDRCADLEAALTRNYGKSNIDRSEGSMTSREYQDEKHQNVVSFYAIPRINICRVSYSYTMTYQKFAQ